MKRWLKQLLCRHDWQTVSRVTAGAVQGMKHDATIPAHEIECCANCAKVRIKKL